jgi:LysR family transcriptional regulator (chromosome initiation inhibitor)
MLFDYAQLAALAAVVGEGSFERAAQVLHVTPSAVSQRIRALEERVGAVLVQRGTPCTATAAGTPLLRHAERVALLEADLGAALPRPARGAAPVRAAPRALLRVAVNADSLATWWVEALARFTQEQPRVQIDLVVEDQDHACELLRRGEVLAAVTSGAAAVQGCNSHALGRLRYGATASPAFVQRWFGRGVNAEALASAPCLVFNRKDELQARWLQRVTRRSGTRAVQPPCHYLPSAQAFVDAALAGVGWGMNPSALARPHLAERRLVELVPGRVIDVPLHWQPSRLALPALDALTRAVLAVARPRLRDTERPARGGAKSS